MLAVDDAGALRVGIRFRGRVVLRSRLGNQVTPRKVDIRLPGKGDSNSHGARPVHQIISMIKWIRTSRLTMKKSLSCEPPVAQARTESGPLRAVHLSRHKWPTLSHAISGPLS